MKNRSFLDFILFCSCLCARSIFPRLVDFHPPPWSFVLCHAGRKPFSCVDLGDVCFNFLSLFLLAFDAFRIIQFLIPKANKNNNEKVETNTAQPVESSIRFEFPLVLRPGRSTSIAAYSSRSCLPSESSFWFVRVDFVLSATRFFCSRNWLPLAQSPV
jgi:hypothetical protein